MQANKRNTTMRTYDAIEIVSKSIIESNLCEAIFVKGSIGRGDDDEYSDVDMYAVVKEENMDEFLSNRIIYLSAYKPILYSSYANFVGPQIIVIFEDGLHFDLYTVSKEHIPQNDEVKVIYDPKKLLKDYVPEVKSLDKETCINLFNGILYNFIEADGAYKRKNYPWTSRILNHSIADASILLRYIYNDKHPYLGLKKINEVLPRKQYLWLEEAMENLNINGFKIANDKIIIMLNYIVENIEEDIKENLNIKFFQWIKKNLNYTLF